MPINLGSVSIHPLGIESVYWGYDLVYLAKKLITISGASPLALVNALAKPIKSLIQYGKCALNGADIVCNNGTLGLVDDDIPEEYVRLEYLESTGTQYIDSGVKINYAQAKNEQITTVQYTKSNSSRELMGSNGYGFWGKSASNKFEAPLGNTVTVTESALSKAIVSLTTDPNANSITFNVNGKQYTASASTFADNYYSVYIFALGGREGAAASFFCNAKVYDYIIKIDGVILAHLLPVKRRSDGVLGMYDIVTNTFKTNDGTGTFVAGPAVDHIGVIGTPEVLTVSCKNLVNITSNDIEQGAISSSTGVNSSSTYRARTIGFVPVKPSTQYTISCVINGYTPGGSRGVFLLEYSTNEGNGYTGDSSSWRTPDGYTFTTGATTNYIRIVFARGNNASYQIDPEDVSKVQLEYGDVATSYQPYVAPQSAFVQDLFAVGDIKDEQDIISGTVTRRCEAVVSDGTTPSGRYIGTVGEGNIIVKVRETGYEGDIVTFDADRVAPLNGLSVNVEPIQDLHGYDNPWPAGGGKNKFDSSLMANAVEATKYITLNLKPNTEYTMSTDDPSKDNGTYADLFFCNIGESTNSKINGVKLNQPITRTSDENGNLRVWYRRYKTWITPEELIAFHTQVEEGSTATAWTPYSNICPISGRTSATVTRTGKNLLAKPFVFRPIPSTLSDCFFIKAGTYTFSFQSIGSATTWRFGVSMFDKDGNALNDVRYKPHTDMLFVNSVLMWYTGLDVTYKTLKFTFIEDCYTRIWFGSGETTSSMDATGAILELGSAASAYEPYAGNTYTIQLGETVYGGMLDVLTGKMMVTDANIASYAGELLPSTWISDRDVYAEGTTPTTGAQVVYKLAEPFEITLTPTQIDTLLGENNLWTDAGTIKVYVADAELIEYVAPQPLSMANGSNTIEVVSNVGDVELQVEAWVHI